MNTSELGAEPPVARPLGENHPWYGETVQIFQGFLRSGSLPTVVGEIEHGHVEAFMADQLARWKPTTALTRHQALRQFFLYLVDEGELTESPMAGIRAPEYPRSARAGRP